MRDTVYTMLIFLWFFPLLSSQAPGHMACAGNFAMRTHTHMHVHGRYEPTGQLSQSTDKSNAYQHVG